MNRALIIVLVLVCTHALAYYKGGNRVYAKWEAEKQKTLVAVAQKAAAQAEATVKVVTQYVDRIKTIEGKTREIEKLIPVYLPAAAADCRFPAAFRLLHDAGAGNHALPEAPASLDASAGAVDAATAAETVVRNYGTCHAWREQLIGLQDWVAEMGRVD